MRRLSHAWFNPFVTETWWLEADNVTEQRDTYSLIKHFRPRNSMTEADIGMTEHRSKNTLGRSVPIKTKTVVEEDGTSEDGSPGPVCICIDLLISVWYKTMFDVEGLKSVQTEMLLADQQWPLSSIINQLCSDWAQLMQITGPSNKHYSRENGLYPDQWLASDDII